MDQTCSRRVLKLLVALLSSGLITGTAWAQAPTPPVVSPTPASKPAAPKFESLDSPDKVVLKVGDRQFTKADMDALIAHLNPQAQHALLTQGKQQLGDQYALFVMLSEQAHLRHLDQSPDFIQRLAFQRLQLEAEATIQEIQKQTKPTPEEIQAYYTLHSSDYDEIMLRQFVIRVKAPNLQAGPAQLAAPTGPGLSPDVAKTRAEAIRKEVAAGTDIKKVMEDFKAPGDVIIEPEPRKVRHGGLRNADMEKVAFALKDGEVSEPVDVPQALVFFQVTGHSHRDLKDATPEIESTLGKQRVEAAMADIKKGTSVWMDEQYFGAPPKPPERPTMGPPVPNTPAKP